MARRLPLLLLLGTAFLPTIAHAATDAPKEPAVQIASPASVYCIKIGGKPEIRRGESGEIGYCHLPDGRIIEEWKLFHAENSPKPEK